MILVGWIIISLYLILVGLTILQPWWLVRYVRQRFYCEKCHKDITITQRFLAEETIRESLEGR